MACGRFRISCRTKRILKRLGLWSLYKKLRWRSRIKGEVHIARFDSEGNLLEVRYIDNVITNVGKAEVAGLIIADAGATAFGYIAIGDGSSTNPGSCTAEAATDTALGNETHRAAATTSLVTTSVTNDTAQLVATFNFTASYSICESGVFNAATGGDMLARATFPVLNVQNGDSLQVTWKIQVQ